MIERVSVIHRKYINMIKDHGFRNNFGIRVLTPCGPKDLECMEALDHYHFKVLQLQIGVGAHRKFSISMTHLEKERMFKPCV